jgi:hypothetical protein
LVFTTEIWRVVDWYEAFDPEMLLIDAFAFEFDLTMEDDLERAGFTLSHDDRLHVDIDRAPTAVAKSIVDPRA